jgi:hypothetical protein
MWMQFVDPCALGGVGPKTAIPPSDESIQRERRMEEALRKLERLRAARLSNPHKQEGVATEILPDSSSHASAAAPADALPTLYYEVVRFRGHWRVLHRGKHSSPYASQEAAVESAMKSAMALEAAGRKVAVKLLRTDGQVFDLKTE